MSAIGVQASNTSSTGTARTSAVLTKPASLAVGDYMLACLSCYLGGAGGAVTAVAPAGWTTVLAGITGGASDTNLWVFGKVADSADVAASNFTFTFDNSFTMAGITRFTNVDTTVPIVVSHSTSATTTTTPTDSGITAGTQPYLVIVVGGTGNGNSRTTSGYQVANTNPTWTEAYDIGAGANAISLAIATAPYTLSTATGNAQATMSGTMLDSVIATLALQPQIQYASTFSVISAIITPTVVKTVTTSILSLASALLSSSVVVTLKKWANSAKNSSSWSNTNKS